MSYCRWSPNCNVYTYADISGVWMTHVTDGRTFIDAGPGESARTLKMLLNEGLKIPAYAIEALEQEAADGR